jgi:hypothetical protein
MIAHVGTVGDEVPKPGALPDLLSRQSQCLDRLAQRPLSVALVTERAIKTRKILVGEAEPER